MFWRRSKPKPIPVRPPRERAEALAKKVGTVIPGAIEIELWPLPILEKLVERVEKLEKA